MTSYNILREDNLLEITDQLDDASLLNYCQTNKDIANLCSHKVWLHRIYSRGLVPLLKYAILYPSLQAFYLEIRHDTIYVVNRYRSNNLTVLVIKSTYFTKVQDFYNTVMDNESGLYNTTIALRIINSKYNINVESTYDIDNKQNIDSKTSFLTDVSDILSYPDLEFRELIIVRTVESVNDLTTKTTELINFNASSLRKLYLQPQPFTTSQHNMLYAVNNTKLYPTEFSKWLYGFYFNISINGYLYILLDYSLVDKNNSNYYLVATPRPEDANLYRGLRMIRYDDEVDYTSSLLKHVITKGTMYKLEDTLTMLSQ